MFRDPTSLFGGVQYQTPWDRLSVKLEYDAPWLYGVAGLTNLARIGSRQHWVSDTVAGSLLGYGIGRIFWESSRAPGRNRPNVIVSPSGIKLSWDY